MSILLLFQKYISCLDVTKEVNRLKFVHLLKTSKLRIVAFVHVIFKPME